MQVCLDLPQVDLCLQNFWPLLISYESNCACISLERKVAKGRLVSLVGMWMKARKFLAPKHFSCAPRAIVTKALWYSRVLSPNSKILKGSYSFNAWIKSVKLTKWKAVAISKNFYFVKFPPYMQNVRNLKVIKTVQRLCKFMHVTGYCLRTRQN